MLKIILLLSLILNIFAKEELYIFPYEKDIAYDRIVSLIKESKESIDLAVYNFTHRKLAKKIITASKNGVQIKIFWDKDKIEDKKSKYKKLCKEKNIICIESKIKMHMKIAVIDKKIAILGSVNWKKESFTKNYENLYITDDIKILKKFNKFFKKLKLE